MSAWTDLGDASIAEDALPTAGVFFALRDRDKANATKPLPWPHGTAQGNTLQATWASLATYKIFIPADVPGGYHLFLPVLCNVQMGASQTEANYGEVRLELGATEGEAQYCDWDVDDVLVLSVEVETSLRGTAQTLTLAGQVPDNLGAGVGYKTTLYAGGPSNAYSALHSIRRAP